MNYQTELMRKILTNEKAQEMIDYVSQIYGDSYVGLWLFQAIGSVVGPVCDISSEMMQDTSPSTATLLLPYYEQEYGIQVDPTMTLEQRRNLVVAAMTSKGSCTPARLSNAISAALGSIPVEIFENTGKNEFTVNIRGSVRSYAPAIAVIERMKPAHLIYKIQGVTEESAETNIDIALAMTRADLYELRASNALAEVLTPTIIENALLKIRRRNPVTGTEAMAEVPHTNDGAGTVTLMTLKGADDGAGTVSLKSVVVTPKAVNIGVKATVRLSTGATLAEVSAAFRESMVAYLLSAKSDGEVKMTRVAAVLSATEGVNDFSNLQIGKESGGTITYGTENVKIAPDETPTIAAENVNLQTS